MKRLFILIRRIIHYYTGRQIPLASAALCYYMTVTVFPLIICLYTLLGYNYDRAMSILNFADGFMNAGTIRIIRAFLSYVEENHSTGMFFAGLTVLVTSASAGVRSMQITIGRMQGGQRYTGLVGVLFSVVFSVVFLTALWFAILTMFTSKELLNLLNEKIPFVDISGGWLWIRYLLLAGIMFLILWGIYRVSRKQGIAYPTWPGALLATIGIVGMSLLFSMFIAASARYPLVYGSLASMILLMLWMFFSCQVIYIGAAFNISLQDMKQKEEETL